MRSKPRERIVRQAVQDQAEVRAEPEKEPDEEEEDLGSRTFESRCGGVQREAPVSVKDRLLQRYFAAPLSSNGCTGHA